jgi:hypothetical protein
MRTAFVRCPECGEDHKVSDVEFVNIEESPEGWDTLTFVCPENGETTQAFVFVK